MDICSQYNHIGEDYIGGQKEFYSKKGEDGTNEFIQKSLPSKLKDKKILDMGCGNGSDILLLESLGANKIYGIDSSALMVGKAKKAVKKPDNVFISNIENTPFEDGFFDIVIGRFSFHYLKTFDNAYKELSRVLKPKGMIILMIPHPFEDLICQKNKIYGRQETVKVELYNNKVSIYFPTHTFNDYFSKSFFTHFYLSGYDEEQGSGKDANEFKTPRFMGIKAIKK